MPRVETKRQLTGLLNRESAATRLIPVVLMAAGLGLLFAPRDAGAYAIKVHEELSRRALDDSAWLLTPSQVDGASIQALTRFRHWLYEAASRHPDAAIRGRFLARYPTVAAFGAMAFRELLAFNRAPHGRIWGIDRSRAARALNARELLATSSGDPDRDGRNRDRVTWDASTRKPVPDSNGNPIPDDPAILNMGRATGLSSQAHAHYGLPQVELSDDPDVLQETPERFGAAMGYPDGPILTLAAEMTQLHADLALLAHAWGQPGSRYLTVTFVGQGLHYLEDVGNQIHTVQVGLYDFFVDAKLQYWWRAFITSGGYLAELRSFPSVGIDILRNHHIAIEQLTSERLFETLDGQETSPAMAEAVRGLHVDDPDLAAALDTALAAQSTPSTFAETITRVLIDVSAAEGPRAYALMREVACGRLGNYGFKVPDDTDKRALDPDTLVCATGEEGRASLEELYALQGRAFLRVATALRRLDRELQAQASRADREAMVQEVLGRFLAARLDLLDAAEARRAAWVSNPPKVSGDAGVRSIGWPLGQVGVIALAYGFFWWRRRRRSSVETGSPVVEGGGEDDAHAESSEEEPSE